MKNEKKVFVLSFLLFFVVFLGFSQETAENDFEDSSSKYQSSQDDKISLNSSSVSSSNENKNEWVVTADNVVTNVLELPSSVTIITTEDIKKSGKSNIIDFLRTLPGIQINEGYYGKSSSSIKMRGSSGDNPFGQVVVFVDDKKLNKADMSPQNWSSIPLSMIETIEVIDGGNSSLYGSGAVGGVIKITTKEYSGKPTVSADIGYGSNTTILANISGGYGTENLGFYLTSDFYQSKGYRYYNDSRNINVGLSGFWDISEKLTIKPSFDFSNLYCQLPGPLTEDQYNENPKQANTTSVTSKDKGEEYSLSPKVSAILSLSDDLSLVLPFSYTYKNRQFDNYGFSTYENNQFEAKPKINYLFDSKIGKFSGVGGFDFEGTLYELSSFSETERKNKTVGYNINQFTFAPYADLNYYPIDSLGINLAGRYSYSPIYTIDGSLKESDEYNSFVYDIGLNYLFSDLISAYAKYNTVFRLPFIDEKSSPSYDAFWQITDESLSINKDLNPEYGNNCEFGFKVFKKDFLKVYANIFYMILNDEISYSKTTFKNENIGKTRRIGSNVSLNFSPIKWLDFSGNINYIDAVFIAGDYKWKKLPLNADLTAYANLSFNLPYGFVISTDYSFTGSRYYSGDNDNAKKKLDPINLIGLSLSFTPKAETLNDSIKIVFAVENLLDIKYPAFASYLSYSDSFTYYPADGRFFYISARWSY